MKKLIISLLTAIISTSAFTQQSEPTEQRNVREEMSSASDQTYWADGAKKWTPRTSIEMRSFRTEDNRLPSYDKAISPDGRYFFIRSWYGDLPSNSWKGRLEVYDVAQVSASMNTQIAPAPIAQIELRASNPTGKFAFGGLSGVTWATDSSALYFLSADSLDHLQGFRWDLNSAKATQFSDESDHGIEAFKVYGDVVTYRRRVDQQRTGKPNPLMVIKRAANGDIDLPGQVSAMATEDGFDFVILLPGREPWILRSLLPDLDVFYFSPDNRKVIVQQWNRRSPEPSTFYLIDLLSQETKPLDLSGPTMLAGNLPSDRRGNTVVFWSADSRHVLFVNVDYPPAQSGRHILDLEVGTITWRDIAVLKTFDVNPSNAWTTRSLPGIGWLAEGKELLLSPEATGNGKGTIVSYSGSGWTTRSVDPTVTPPTKTLPGQKLTLELRTARNEPDVLVAKLGEKELVLSKTDRVLAGVRIVKEEPFKIATRDSNSITAGLTLPPGIKKGERVPLIVQFVVRESDFDKFQPDGYSPGFMARQAVVARGMAVLQLPHRGPENSMRVEDKIYRTYTTNEVPILIEMIDDAVAKLDQAGIIDPTRVGITGFSRTGFITAYSITHPKRTKFAAAIGLDYASHTLVSELVTHPQNPLTPKVTGGGLTFWQDRKTWLEHDIFLNADKMRTPLLMGTCREAEQLYNFHPYIESLQINRRPIDAVWFPSTLHVLITPAERFAAMTMTVDWFSFWLKGEEDPDPTKSEQYERWRMIRDKWTAQQQWEAAGNPVGSEPKSTSTKS